MVNMYKSIRIEIKILSNFQNGGGSVHTRAYQWHSCNNTSKFLDLMKLFCFLPELADYIVPLCVIPAK